MSKFIVCDIDGCISNDSKRRHHFNTGDITDQLNKFYAEINQDIPNWPCIDIISNTNHSICLLSARPESYREQTIEWLSKWKIEYKHLLLRPDKNAYPSSIDYIQRHVWKHIKIGFIMKHHEIILAIDDDEITCNIYKSLNLNTIHFTQEQLP